jgi:heat-inducible transcriptional repressor
MSLSDRRAKILALIVEDFVGTANPVGSQSLVQRHTLGMSSATVRNEMAALEEEGMISHPHTSAGRIPSNKGYRYYVHSLMNERALSLEEKVRILHQFQQTAHDLENWVGLAASVLAQSVRNVALVTEPRVGDVRLKQLQLVEVSESRALLIVVTSDAVVHQLSLELEEPVSQDQLTRLANRLNAELGGKEASELPKHEGEEAFDWLDAAVVGRVRELLTRAEEAQASRAVIDGVRQMLRQPEFEDSDRMLDVLEAVEERHLRGALPTTELTPGGLAIVIGDENRDGHYQEMSFVLARYGTPSGASGVLGVLGPTRMDYADAVSHVRYVGDVLTELMREFYGEQ